MIVLDTSVIYALLDARDRRHDEAAGWYEDVDDELVTTPLVLAEVDHLAGARAGRRAVAAFRRDVVRGAYAVEWWADAPRDSVGLAERHADLALGLTDASLMCLAGRLRCLSIATFDDRHFRAVRPLAGGDAFRLLPADA